MASGNSTAWTLDPQLAGDTVAAGDLALSRVLLNDDANYPWLILAPRQPGAVELIDLAAADRAQLMDDIAQVSAALKRLTGCHKLNVAALGNVVAQLHVHVIARFHGDAAWPDPVWGKVPRKPYTPDAREQLVARLRQAIPMVSPEG